MFKLLAVRRYGGSLPVAVIQIGGSSSLYDLEGVRDLMRVFRHSEEYPSLVEIERQILIPGEYKDIQDDDLSGQGSLFGSS